MKRGITICACGFLAVTSSPAQTTIQFTAIHALPSNQVELIWSSDTNRWYAIERTADLADWNNDFDFVIPDDSASIESNHWTLSASTNPCFFRLFASFPVGPQDNVYTNLGTASNDTQIVTGTTNMDYVIQRGEGSNDTQYASTGDNDDWTAQYGGAGADSVTAYGGLADDWLYQEGGEGNDTVTASAGSGDDRVIQFGNGGDDEILTTTSLGADFIVVDAGSGDDTIRVNAGEGDDTIRMLGGDGDDVLTYDVSDGSDTARIDGGDDTDILTVNHVTIHGIAIRLPDGTDLYTNGTPGSIITVMRLETIYAVEGTTTNWTGSAP